jgi:hypothetical protein
MQFLAAFPSNVAGARHWHTFAEKWTAVSSSLAGDRFTPVTTCQMHRDR